MDEHDRIADQHLEEADRVQEVSENLDEDIKKTREDWDAKKKTGSVPGAIKTEEEAEAEKHEEPNEFELEHRSPETAEAQGPAALSDTDDDADDDSGDDES